MANRRDRGIGAPEKLEGAEWSERMNASFHRFAAWFTTFQGEHQDRLGICVCANVVVTAAVAELLSVGYTDHEVLHAIADYLRLVRDADAKGQKRPIFYIAPDDMLTDAASPHGGR